MSFTTEELDYLRSQPLARFATRRGGRAAGRRPRGVRVRRHPLLDRRLGGRGPGDPQDAQRGGRELRGRPGRRRPDLARPLRRPRDPHLRPGGGAGRTTSGWSAPATTYGSLPRCRGAGTWRALPPATPGTSPGEPITSRGREEPAVSRRSPRRTSGPLHHQQVGGPVRRRHLEPGPAAVGRRSPTSARRTGHGPAQVATRPAAGRSPAATAPRARRSTSPRPATATGRPAASTTSTGSGGTWTVAGAGAGTVPGQGSATQPGRAAGRGSVTSMPPPAPGPPARPDCGRPATPGPARRRRPAGPGPGPAPGRPGHPPRGVDRPGPAGAEAELAALGGHDLVGRQPQPGDARSRVGWAQPPCPLQPTLELPAHPIGDGQGAERALGAPHPLVLSPCSVSAPTTRRVQASPSAARRRWRSSARPRATKAAASTRSAGGSSSAARVQVGAGRRGDRGALVPARAPGGGPAGPRLRSGPPPRPTGRPARAPRVRTPSRSSTSTRSAPVGPPASASTVTGIGARKAGLSPGGTTRAMSAGRATRSARRWRRAARAAAKGPSATPTRTGARPPRASLTRAAARRASAWSPPK